MTEMYEIDFVKKLAWNVRKYLTSIDRQNTTIFYGFIATEVDDGHVPYDDDKGIQLLVVCNRTDWSEEIRLKMYGVKFVVFTTDRIKSIHDLKRSVVLDFSFELEFEKRMLS